MPGFRTLKQDLLKLLQTFQVCDIKPSVKYDSLNLLVLIFLEPEGAEVAPTCQDVPRFIMKLWNLVEQPDYQELIRWSQVSGAGRAV